MMHILRVINTVNPASGGPIHGLTESSRVLEKLGHRITVASADDPQSPWAKAFPFTLHALGPARGSYGYCPPLGHWLRQHYADYDAVLVHGLWQHHGLAVHQAWRTQRKTQGPPPPPYFVFTHGMLDPWFKRAYPLKHLKKWLYWPWAEYRVLRDAAGVLFTCEEERRLARQSFWLYRVREKVVAYGCSPPACDLSTAAQLFRQSLPALGQRPFLLFLGRLHEKKGIDLLIQAWQQTTQPQPDLVIAGPEHNNSYTAHLKTLAGSSPHIHFTGALAGAPKWGALAAAEALVLPSHQENFGIVVAEALSTGTPALLSYPVNIWREVVEAGAGLAASDTAEGTRQLLERWHQLDAQEREDMSHKARSLFQQRFAIEAAARDLLAAITEPKTCQGV